MEQDDDGVRVAIRGAAEGVHTDEHRECKREYGVALHDGKYVQKFDIREFGDHRQRDIYDGDP